MERARRQPTRRVVLTVAVVVLVAAFLWAVEVGSPRTVDATGVDELRVPLDDLTSVDFVVGVDNPWLPLHTDALWVHRGEWDGRSVTVRTEVVGTVEVGDVVATRVRTSYDPGEEHVRLYAQDVDGHVWLLGEEGRWVAGDGVPAGLAMPAEPRRGDGFVRVPGETSGAGPQEWWSIDERGEEVRVPAGEYEVLLVDATAVRERGEETYTSALARGTGEVLRVSVEGTLELVEYRSGTN